MSAKEYPSRLFVEVSTGCDLKCDMCVKQNGIGGIPEGGMSPDTFEALTPPFRILIPRADKCVLIFDRRR